MNSNKINENLSVVGKYSWTISEKLIAMEKLTNDKNQKLLSSKE
jgi:hypothetical protein